MAGIGFRIDSLLRSGDARSQMLGGLTSVFVAAGPALSVIATLALMGPIVSYASITIDEVRIFATVTYCFMFSMILFGPWEMIALKYISDMIYTKNERTLGSFLITLVAASCAINGLVVAIFFAFADFNWRELCLVVITVNAISITRVSIIFLGASRVFLEISTAFLVGMFVSCAGIPLAAHVIEDPFVGPLSGFAFGQCATAAILLNLVLGLISESKYLPTGLMSYAKQYYVYGIIGFCGCLSLWADKIIYWYFGPSVQIVGPLYATPSYDTMILLGFLQTIPALSYFLVKVETRIYFPLRSYLASLEQGGTQKVLEQERQFLQREFLGGFRGVFTVQLLASLASLSLLPIFATIFDFAGNFSGTNMSVPIIAVSLHVLAMLLQTGILYMDQSRYVAILTAAHLVLNVTLTSVPIMFSINLPLGSGYLVASGIVLLGSWLISQRAVRDITYLIMSKYARAAVN